jgi:hypothetical protein
VIQLTKLPLALFLAGAFGLFPAGNLFAKYVPEAHPMVRTNATEQSAHWHTITIKPPPKAPKIHFYQKLNPVWWFKNADDPKPPAWYKPDDKHRRLKWSFRNPLHNFHFYVVGVADKEFSRSGKFPALNSDPRGGWDFEVARYKFIFLPFVSYHKPNFDFYFGWRNRGNFGIKVNINPKKGPKLSIPPVPDDDDGASAAGSEGNTKK